VLGAALGGMTAAVPVLAQTKPADPTAVEALKTLLDAYHKAFSAHDLPAVLELFAPNAVMVGTGPGEIWGGPEEIGTAHKNFFQLFDPGKQKQEPKFRDGHVLGDMAWLVAMSNVSLTKGATTTAFGLNASVIFEKTGGAWLIRVFHLSNVAAAAK
jgi:uncharacterized protein (TIGR02246 family)